MKKFSRIAIYLLMLAYVLAYQFASNWGSSNLQSSRSFPVKYEPASQDYKTASEE